MTDRGSLFHRALPGCHGIRVLPDRWGRKLFVDWSPLVIDFGYLRFNRWWWHNLHCRFPLVFRLHHGVWPTYWYWDKGLPVPCDGGFACSADTHIHGCFSDYGQVRCPDGMARA